MAEGTTQRKSPKDMWQQESGCDVMERIIYSHPGGSFEGQPFLRANSFQATFFWEGVGFQPSLPVMDWKSDGSKQFSHFMQIDFLRSVSMLAFLKLPCHLTFQT